MEKDMAGCEMPYLFLAEDCDMGENRLYYICMPSEERWYTERELQTEERENNMGGENKRNMSAEEKRGILAKMQQQEELYGIVSLCTRMPYVLCDEDTYDDEIYIFMKAERAQEKAAEMKGAGEPVKAVKIEKRQFLTFFSDLYMMGVNCVVVEDENGERNALQLPEIIHRVKDEELPEGKVRVENPQLHLTALYLMQKTLRLSKKEVMEDEEIKELQEEVMADFKKGRFLVAFEAQKGVPLLREKDGTVYQPVFTDIIEFQKFNRENTFKSAVIEAEKIPQILSEEAKGVTINPFGVNLQLQMGKVRK